MVGQDFLKTKIFMYRVPDIATDDLRESPVVRDLERAIWLLVDQLWVAYQEAKPGRSNGIQTPITSDTSAAVKVCLGSISRADGQTLLQFWTKSLRGQKIPDDVIESVRLSALYCIDRGVTIDLAKLAKGVWGCLLGERPHDFDYTCATNLTVLDTRRFMERCLCTLVDPNADEKWRLEMQMYVRKTIAGINVQAIASDPLLSRMWLAAFHRESHRTRPKLAISSFEEALLIESLETAANKNR